MCKQKKRHLADIFMNSTLFNKLYTYIFKYFKLIRISDERREMRPLVVGASALAKSPSVKFYIKYIMQSKLLVTIRGNIRYTLHLNHVRTLGYIFNYVSLSIFFAAPFWAN